MFIQSSSSKKPAAQPIKIAEENRTVVLVWLPKKDDQATSALRVIAAARLGTTSSLNIGHVSMVTPQRYVSLFPAESTRGNLFKVFDAAYHNFDDDIASEGGAPDTIVTLYSLDTEAMAKAFSSVQASDAGFVLAGDISGTRTCDAVEAYNCNGLVYALLQKGGVDKITPYTATSTFPFYISPDKFDAYVKLVKSEELKQHPETAGFKKITKEYDPAQDQKPRILSKLGL